MLSKKHKRQFIFLLLTAFWGYLIFYLSSVPNLASNLPSNWDFVLRKFAHAFVFMILTYFLANSFDSRQRRYLILVIIVVILYALIDELHQIFVPGRYGSAKDIGIDSIGIFLGMWLYKLKSLNKIFK